MRSEVIFEPSLIAPCGMNCGTCIAFLRNKNRCNGCRDKSEGKAVSVQRCFVVNCDRLKLSGSGFCYDCQQFPCRRIRQLDKRYRTKYRTSFIENLSKIKNEGIESFLKFETNRRKCPDCGSVTSVHRNYCLVCQSKLN